MSADPSVSPVGSPSTVADGVDVFELGAEHEQVVFCNDHATGLRAIVAIHSTALGPGLGGTRFYPYATTADAIRDVLNLSRGMSYKAALAGLDLGGGKAVIIGDPMKDKTEALLRAYGRFVQAIGGRYYTACDVGTYSEDMDVVARECSVRHRPDRRPRWRRRLVGAHGVRRLPGHARQRGGALGRADAVRPHRRHRRGRQGRPPPGQAPRRGRRAGRGDRRPPAGGRADGAGVRRDRGRRRRRAGARGHRRLRAVRDGRRAHRRGGRRADRQDRLRRRQQPAVPPRHREGAGRPRDPLRARLLRELRRPDPGGRRARGLQLRAGRAARVEDLRHDQGGLRAGPHRRGHPRRGRRPSRRAPDARRRPPARALPAP